MSGHVTGAVAALAGELPAWVSLLRAPNPGPMTLDGTNTWVLRAPDADHAIVVDPGPADEGHLKRIAEHGPIGLILITHGHPDHTEGAARLRELVGAPVLAADPAHTIGGTSLSAETTLDDTLGIHLLNTPGHTSDSVCFLIECGDERVVLTGDTILGRGTTVVAHPDGNLGDYLGSLELLSAYTGIAALPGHGPALADCAAAAEFYLAHRRARLDQVRSAVNAGARTPADVVAAVYADVDRSLWWAAEWSVRAQLEYLGVDSGESAPGVSGLEHT
ncbi:MBL fold metallo-hydrolase [Micromonospora sp. NPDC049662]|uniref:MBL fold metallo-hydrolase n=1 Tax=Micromonospora sp. NPDC049662 TaxID=3155397 RepID=UPI003425FF97